MGMNVSNVDMARAKRLTEAQLQATILDLVRDLGLDLAYHTLDSRGSQSGFLDLIIAGPCGLILAELKREGQSLTKGKWVPDRRGRSIYHPGQQDWFDAISGLTVPPVAALWKPQDWYSGRIDDELKSIR